jgi:hypothetical protein
MPMPMSMSMPMHRANDPPWPFHCVGHPIGHLSRPWAP